MQSLYSAGDKCKSMGMSRKLGAKATYNVKVITLDRINWQDNCQTHFKPVELSSFFLSGQSNGHLSQQDF